MGHPALKIEPRPDQDLIAMADELLKQKAVYEALWNAEQDKWEREDLPEPDHPPSEDFYAANVAPLAAQVEQMKATTLAGFIVKAKVVMTFEPHEFHPEPDTDLSKLVAELAAMGDHPS